MNAQKTEVVMHILRQVNKAGIAVLKNIIDQLLHNAENDQFFFRFQPVFIFMKTAAGIDAAGAADFLKQVIDSGFQTKIFKCWWHQAMADIADQLNGVIQ